ncbi:xanthine dehydrogenase small subunit [Comamonas sp. B-9]|uniref:xanthine dehydrogenase small subunit n=1 Tax=Comamonas sp. B-9 TaxID=1055192 RepID=UPI00039592C2|nr:xanthine dehydrogenase small subunit [Comamonas sp. B-9]
MSPMTAPQAIRFYHQGRITEVEGLAPTRSVLDWLREDARCTGTKEGCNEGDCGACTVMLAELAEPGDPQAVQGLKLQTVNACIQLLPSLHGKALFTVEDMKTSCRPKDAGQPCSDLHPVQQAMVDCHGSQCGFCTPGFVMSLWSVYERQQAQQGAAPTRQQLADALSGNLCRCTGYRPILDAGQQMLDLPARQLDAAPVVTALQALRSDADWSYAYRPSGGQPQHFHAPASVESLAQLRAALPDARMIGGTTDVALWINKQFRPLGDLIAVGRVAELRRIEERDGMLCIGAGASLESAWAALAQRFPTLTEVWLRFASPPVRHAGTMGGNVANGSPIGDAPPVLMALDAEIELRLGERLRRMPLTDFYVDYMKNQLEPGEWVQGLRVPLAVQARQVRAYKISKRFDCDISALCAGFSLQLDAQGQVETVRLAFGGMAATVRRAAKAEAALLGQAWTAQAVQRAQAALAEDFQPMTDMRASAAYRLKVAQNLLQRLWLETRADAPLPADATTVWAAMPHMVRSAQASQAAATGA